jgi:hypothetical protein
MTCAALLLVLLRAWFAHPALLLLLPARAALLLLVGNLLCKAVKSFGMLC